ncbi:unnamed protein product [Hyaloperonospora brassicae]|uniref:Homoserine dehydrogenase n=1 Tax=Hyaloperonospora brassicae TaxID=162125 RepID=A0AAV0V5U2_HYABA|nr:unnamed protein product [Hyaloperonospora brassicae]
MDETHGRHERERLVGRVPDGAATAEDGLQRLESVPVVITGSIGCTQKGHTTTLGRSGADDTATLVGAMLCVDHVVIYTDTAGVVNADPDIVDRAVAVSHLSHYERGTGSGGALHAHFPRSHDGAADQERRADARSVCRLPSTLWRESTATAARTEFGRAFFMYTSTVGASLPTIDTLGNILRTGDRILGIDTSLGGPMNFVANEVMKGKKLSEAVGEVLCRGYCERDPREDFTGTDMVAKVVVLARALGVHLHASEVRVEPFIPHSVLDTIAWSHDMEVDDIVTGLEAYDEEFRERYYMPAVSESKRLCHVASINLAGSLSIEATIRPLLVSEDHPVYYTKDNEVAFGVSSVQYPNPLVLKGSGTGASASATGVLRDVLTILSRLSGNNVRA